MANQAEEIEAATTERVDRAENELEPVEVWSPVNDTATTPSNAAPPPTP